MLFKLFKTGLKSFSAITNRQVLEDLDEKRTSEDLSSEVIVNEVELDEEITWEYPEVAEVAEAAEVLPDFEEIPLSDFIRDDPAMQALHPKLKMKPRRKDPSEYSIFRTVFGAAGNDLNDKSVKRKIEDIEGEYANFVAGSRIFVSYKDAVPGYRRVVFLGPEILSIKSNSLGFIGVTDDGQLKSGAIKPKSRNSEPLQSVADALEVVRVGRKGWEIFDTYIDFNLNPHTKSFRSILDGGLERTERLMSTFGNKARFKIKHTIRNNTMKRVNLARWAVCDALDPEALRAMRGTGLTSIQSAKWLTGGDTLEDASEKSMMRLQAIKAYPILARKFEGSWSFRDAIDERAPLAPMIAEAYNVDLHKVKRLQGLTWQKASTTPRDPDDRIHEVLKFPDNLVPKNRNEYRDIEVLRDFGSILYGTGLNKTLERLSVGGSPWRLTDRMKKTSGRDVRDAVDFLASKIFLPAKLCKIRDEAESRDLEWDESEYGPSRMVQELRHKILDLMKPKEVLELSERYHRNIARYEDMLNVVSTKASWKPLIGKLELMNGYTARELTSEEELKSQGLSQNHCVGGYGGRIMRVNSPERGQCVIFSIERDGEVKSTLEINCGVKTVKLKDPATKAQVEKIVISVDKQQNQSYGNSTPSDETEAACRELMDSISRGDPEMFNDYCQNMKITERQRQREDRTCRYVSTCGFNPWDRASLETSWNELKNVLPRGVRKAGIDALIDNSSIEGCRMSVTLGSAVSNIWDDPEIAEHNLHPAPVNDLEFSQHNADLGVCCCENR